LYSSTIASVADTGLRPVGRWWRESWRKSFLELLREAIANLRRLAIMGNVGTSGVMLEMGEIERTARRLGI
jgi:hypothetical protein